MLIFTLKSAWLVALVKGLFDKAGEMETDASQVYVA